MGVIRIELVSDSESKGDGRGSISIYGDSFEDENFKVSHSKAGLLSMANSGKDTNGCQFFITCKNCEFLDGKHVVFGKVLDDEESMTTVRKIENVKTDPQQRPRLECVITQCGEL